MTHNYEYREVTVLYQQPAAAKPIAIVTVGLPRHLVRKLPSRTSLEAGFRETVSPRDTRRLLDHIGSRPGPVQGTLYRGWQPVPKPAGDPVLESDSGTRFWVEKLA
ncbi:MAG: hypothetical protein JO069_15560 [Verrucomicrobia bacterium]|nr:hypothetical protein [Verrucomicrobiota bacterium]